MRSWNIFCPQGICLCRQRRQRGQFKVSVRNMIRGSPLCAPDSKEIFLQKFQQRSGHVFSIKPFEL
uniref:Uncharacterized protein n=1 Tax=Anguilla anguilla TaxID=7936 RepID=A0A0E9SHH7_ANGAN